ncbi:MAG: competence/damage-inducible protein A [Bacteroidales bacterium]
MKAEIIAIGDELLIGQTIDTNSAWIGAELSLIGFDVNRKVTIHDRRPDILAALAGSAGKADVVLITGGLGPTSDDITKPTLCEFFNTRLVINEEVLGMITELLARRNFQMGENNRRQAEVPESCRVLTNAMGTAPGMWFEKDNTVFISMPGVPYEMKYIMNQHVVPMLKDRFRSQHIIHRTIMTYGTSEARLSDLLAGFEKELPGSVSLAYLPSSGINKLRLTVTGPDRNNVSAILEEQVGKLYSVIPDLIYGENEETLEIVVGRELVSRGMTLGTAESCTGGNIAHLITSVPGSSGYFRGSVITYDNNVKTSLLGISEELIGREGAVSEPVARAMAEAAAKLLATDFSVSTSGIAGPDGGTPLKPVGTVWIAVTSPSGTVSELHTFGTDRMLNITRFSFAALNLLRKQIIRT